MLQSQSTVAQKKTDQNTKVLFVLIQSHLLALSGVWEWGMHTDEILCSDVMLSVGEVNGIPSTRCLIHPEDLKDFTAKLQALDSNSNINFRFRIITTYGEVKIISCSGSIQKTEDALFMPGLQQQEINGYYHQKQIIAAYEQTQLELQAYRGAESLSQTGIWYINTSTHKMFYSDYIYKIHGFPPQSFNAHYNTFTPFIHPEDKAVVTESFDNAYRQKIPLHLSYRVITAAGEEKNVRQSTRWSFNDKGELILSGLMEDITLERKQEQELVTLKDQEIFHNNVLRFADEQKKMAGWYVHIFTRKVFYSKNIYRLYGMKGDGMALTPSILLNFVHPDDRSMVAESDRKILKEHLPPTIEFRIIRSDGKVRYLRQKGKTIINSQQEMMVIGITEDISDEVILTRKLNEERMNNLVEHALYRQAEQLGDMAAWAWDKQTNEITWSEGFSELLGYKPGALKLSQATLTKYVHPDDRKLFTEYINQILLDGIERNFQFGMLKKDKVQKINAHFSILEIESKTLFLASFRNVTSYDSLQQKLAAQERFKDMVSDATIERIFVTDLNNYLVEWNSRCEEAFNIKADKAIGNNIFDVLPEWKTPDMLLNFQHALNGDFITLKDLQEKRLQRYYSHQLIPMKNEMGEVVGVLNVLRDTTQEYKLKKELTDRLHFIEKLLEASVDRIIVLDQQMNYLYWNKKAEEYYNMPKQDVIGKNILEVFPSFIDDPSFNEFKQALRGNTVHFPPSEKTRSPYDTFLIPLKDEKDVVTGVLWIAHDISKERTINRYHQKAAEVFDALNDNYVELDHDLKFLYLNPKAEEFFGKAKEELIGHMLWEAFPQIIGTDLLQRILETGEKKQRSSGEFISPTKNRWLYVSMAPTVDGIVITFFDIQEIKEANLRLEEEHKRLKEAQAIGRIGNFEWNLVTKKFHWSEELHRIYELEQGNIPAGLDVLMKHCHYEDRDALQSALDKVLSKGEAVNITSRIVTAIGKQRYVNHQLNATLNDEGKPIHVRGVVQDISELVTFQTEIKEKEHFIRKIAEATPDVITLFDLQKKSVLYVNHSITSLLGYSIEELMAMSFEQRLGTTIHPDDFSCIDAIYKAAAQASDQDLITQEYRMVKRDGTLCWVRNRSKVFRRNEAGEGIQVLGIIQDITEDRKIRSELSNRALFIENIMNSSIDRIYVLDATYKILEWNQRCEQYYNLKREEVLGKSLFDLFPKLAADELITGAMEKALGGEPAYLAPMTEIYINCISERFYLPLKDDDDSIKGMLCILHDVTKMQNAKQELKDLNSTLEKKNIELECKNEEITTLAFVASHDLKEPLRKIHTFGDWLLEREAVSLSERGKDYLVRMNASAKKLTYLLGDILTLTKIHADDAPMQAVDLNQVLQTVLMELDAEVRDKNAVINAENLPTIIGSENQLTSLFLNLLQNSIKFHDEKRSPVIQITAVLVDELPPEYQGHADDNKYIRVSFIDNGIGFNNVYAQKIFKVFQQLPNDRTKPAGSGIGLAVCKKIMEMHKGFIVANSKPGKGSAFHCYFPK